jgi:hypothetical protein
MAVTSRHDVRLAVRDHFAAPPIEGLTTVHAAKPTNWGGRTADFYPPGGARFGASAFVWIAGQEEETTAMVGLHPGARLVTFQVSLVTLFRAPVATADADEVTAAHDRMLDAIVERLRSDATLGGQVMEAGKTGVVVETDAAKDDGDHAEIWAGVQFELTAWVS